MAQAPKCKVCGERHFGDAHIWPSEKTGNTIRVGIPTAAIKDRHRLVIAAEPSAPIAPYRKIPIKLDEGRALDVARAHEAQVRAKLAEPNAILEDYLRAERARKAAYMREYRARKKGPK